jgi:hypothetical protein
MVFSWTVKEKIFNSKNMKRMSANLTYFKKLSVLTILFVILSNAANATVFTAVLSGNFSSSLTWGGAVPGGLLTSDVIIIPSGITVSLTTDETFSGTASLMVDGTLNSSVSGSSLVITSGSLSGTGTISVDSLALGLTSGFTFTGNINVPKLTSLGANISSAANITVGNTLNLNASVLDVTAGNLTMGAGSTINLSGGTVATGGTGMIHLTSAYNVLYTGASVTTGVELTGSGLGSITVNVPGTVTLSSNETVNGTLTLSSGALALNNYTLTFGVTGNLSAAGSGTITGTATSNIVVNTTGSLSGALKFSSGGDVLNNLTINTGSGSTVNLGSNLTVDGALNLTSGKIKLGSNDLKIAAGGMISGGAAGSYVITDGTGNLVMNLSAGATDTFKTGTLTNFAPIAITANTGSATGDVSINVLDGVHAAGTTGTLLSVTQPMVNATWLVSSTAITSGINYNMMAMWSAGMEVNGFDRTHAYISHYTGGAWDLSAISSAGTSGSLYSMTRAGITSLSPFMVADRTAVTTSASNITPGSADVLLYPEPAANTLYFSTTADIDNISVYDLNGIQVMNSKWQNNFIPIENLPAGIYIIRFTGKNVNTVKRFIKE